MKENKAEIARALLPALQMTYQCAGDLKELKYSGRLKNGEEYVTAVFQYTEKKINVTADSGIAMLYDIVKALKAL